MNNLQLLNQSIVKHYNKCITIAVVGNAGVKPEDETIVNRSDVVVRFNNYSTRHGITQLQDKARCDILFSTFDLHSHDAKPKDIVIGIPYPFKAAEIVDKPDKWYPNARHWMVNPYENLKLCQELGLNSEGYKHPLPSIGFTALWHMRNWPFRFYVCGFSWYWNKETQLFQNHHLSNKNYPKQWNHSYPKEVEWIMRNLWGKENFTFSSECCRLLRLASLQLK